MLFAVCASFWALQTCSEDVQVKIVMSEFDIFVSSMSIITLAECDPFCALQACR